MFRHEACLWYTDYGSVYPLNFYPFYHRGCYGKSWFVHSTCTSGVLSLKTNRCRSLSSHLVSHFFSFFGEFCTKQRPGECNFEVTGRRDLFKALTTCSLWRCAMWVFVFPVSFTAVVTAWNISFPFRNSPLTRASSTDVSGARVSRNSAWSMASCLSMAFVDGITSCFTKASVAEVSSW